MAGEMMPLVALEEHFFSSHVKDWARYGYGEQFKHLPNVVNQLLDLDALRLSHMDASGIAMQVLSHGPGLSVGGDGDALSDCRRANDLAHGATQRHPGRFAAFAALPMGEPEAAARELTRCVTQMGFRGALVDNHVAGRHYEGAAYHVFWRTAQELDVPVYLHPTWPADGVQKPQYEGELSAGAVASLGSSGWGWHSDVGAHILKLFAAGIFDLFPKLKIIVGHFGEMIPFMLERVEYLSKRWGERKRPFGVVYRENIWITTSGCWSVNPMACILRNTPVDHILFSVDYPFAKNEEGRQFMQDLEKSGLVTQEQLEMIGYRNSEKLLGLSVADGRKTI
ncbi:uncharacterized protein PV09_04177 [Verruconis gallopava]|uniref:Amidohydrolase-related domain-containing protein n=1 Tax=Verruconis gallopava TaxID=253628 RepID=A0A0D1YWJ2_9PEZI|nr:uncharacterized protein PV09_04177 [Verruconis gallopava]KIW05022.1 hypothetical protein PV09_04177 [Verruconis gallopava]